MDALELLRDDHDTIQRLLEDLGSTTERAVKTRRDLFGRIKAELEVHEAIEEEILYPTLREHAEAKEIVLEGYEEHEVVDTLLGELAELPVDDETWGPKATVMRENLEHHIEEEEGAMFEQARELLGKTGLADLGERMLARKRELTSS